MSWLSKSVNVPIEDGRMAIEFASLREAELMRSFFTRSLFPTFTLIVN